MKEFMFSHPTKVYFGEGAAEKALKTELAHAGDTVMMAYGGGSVKKNGIYDEISGILRALGKRVVDFSGIMPNPTYAKVQSSPMRRFLSKRGYLALRPALPARYLGRIPPKPALKRWRRLSGNAACPQGWGN